MGSIGVLHLPNSVQRDASKSQCWLYDRLPLTKHAAQAAKVYWRFIAELYHLVRGFIRDTTGSPYMEKSLNKPVRTGQCVHLDFSLKNQPEWIHYTQYTKNIVYWSYKQWSRNLVDVQLNYNSNRLEI